jgi:TonB dependent receptor
MGAMNLLAGTPAPAPTGKGIVPPPPGDPCPGGISYTNLELMYVYTDPDGGGDNGDGVNLRLTYALNQNLYIVADAAYNEFEDTEQTHLALGIGGHISLTNNIDLAADAGVVWYDLSSDYNDEFGLDDNDFGWYVRPHFRAKWGCLEAHLGAQYVDVDGDSRTYQTGTAFVATNTVGWEINDWSAFLDLYYHLNANWDIAAGASLSYDFNAFRVGVRYRF